MTLNKMSTKNNNLTVVPVPQSPDVAGKISAYSGVTPPSGWLGLSTTTSTTITNAENLYPDLWDNSNAAWRSGSDLIVPPVSNGIYDTQPIADTNFFTFNNFGTAVVESTWWWRSANRLKAIGVFQGTGSQGGSPNIQFPAGLNIDRTLSPGDRDIYGRFYRCSDGAGSAPVANPGNFGVLSFNGPTDRIYTSGWSTVGLWELNQVLNSDDRLAFEIDAPIAEWAAQTNLPIIKLYNDQADVAVSDVLATLNTAGNIPAYHESGEGDITNISNWPSPGTAKYRWLKTGNKIDFWFYVDSQGGAASDNSAGFAFDIPPSVPQPINHISNDYDGSFGSIAISGTTSGAGFRKHFSSLVGTTYSINAALDAGVSITYWGGHATWMTTAAPGA